MVAGTHLDYSIEKWQDLKRPLHRLCTTEYGLALIERLCVPTVLDHADSFDDAPEAIERVVKEWFEDYIAMDLQRRISLPDRDEVSDTQWAGPLLSLFFDIKELARHLRMSRLRICAAYQEEASDEMMSYLWKALSQYFFDARLKLDGQGDKGRNVARIEKEIRLIRQEWWRQQQGASPIERRRLAAAMEDPAALATELLIRLQDPKIPFTLRGVSTLDGILSYIRALPSTEWPDEFDAAANYLTEEDLAAFYECIERGVRLTKKELQAILSEYGVETLSEVARMDNVQSSRTGKTHVRNALKKLRECFDRYYVG